MKTFGVSRETRVSKKLFHVKLINYRYFNCLIFCHSSDNRTAVAFVSPFRPFDIRGRLPRGAFAFALSCFCAPPDSHASCRLTNRTTTRPLPTVKPALRPLSWKPPFARVFCVFHVKHCKNVLFSSPCPKEAETSELACRTRFGTALLLLPYFSCLSLRRGRPACRRTGVCSRSVLNLLLRAEGALERRAAPICFAPLVFVGFICSSLALGALTTPSGLPIRVDIV